MFAFAADRRGNFAGKTGKTAIREKMIQMNRKRLFRQSLILLLVLALFLGFNGSLYRLLTCRLTNNFSDSAQPKMVDVGRYLPFEAGSDLPKIHTDFHLDGDLPVLDGAAALVPVYAAVIHNIYPEGSVTYEGGAFSDDNYYGENFAPDSRMQYRNTVRGYKAIVDETADVLFSASPSAEQKQYAAEKGVELVYVPIGLEAFVFFVNGQNPVNGLTTAQVRDIYGGSIRNWKDVGGPDRPINPVTRLQGSGSQSVMDAFMGDRPVQGKSPLALFGASLGYSFRFYLMDMVGDADVKVLRLNDVYPDRETIRSGQYPIVTSFYAVYRANDPNENVKKLVDWLLSPEGQSLIEATGYVPLG